MQRLQALCVDCHSEKTLRESAQPTSLKSRVCPGVMEAYHVALRAQEPHRGVAPDAELPDLLGRDAQAPPVVAEHGVEVRTDLLEAKLQQLRKLPGHAERLVHEGTGQSSKECLLIHP